MQLLACWLVECNIAVDMLMLNLSRLYNGCVFQRTVCSSLHKRLFTTVFFNINYCTIFVPLHVITSLAILCDWICFRLRKCNLTTLKTAVRTERCLMQVYGATLPPMCEVDADDIPVTANTDSSYIVDRTCISLWARPKMAWIGSDGAAPHIREI